MRRRLRGALRVGAAASFRALPGIATPLIDVGAALLIDRARVQLDVGWQLPRRFALADTTDAAAEIGLVAAAVRGGWAPRVRTVEFPLLAGIEIGNMTARGIGVDNAERVHSAWVALLAGAGITWNPVPAFAIALDPALVVGLARQRFGVGRNMIVQEFYRASVVGARIGLAMEVRLP